MRARRSEPEGLPYLAWLARGAASHPGHRVRSAGRSVRAEFRRAVRAQAPVGTQAAAADAEPRRDAAVAEAEVPRQVASGARVCRVDEPAAAARREVRQAVARGARLEAAEPQVVRPSEPEAVRRAAAVEVQPSGPAAAVQRVVGQVAELLAAPCSQVLSADRERPAPSRMTMARRERIATWKMQRSREGSISTYSYPPFDGCPSARFIDVAKRHARWTDNGEAAMWREARGIELLSGCTMRLRDFAIENERSFIGMNCF